MCRCMSVNFTWYLLFFLFLYTRRREGGKGCRGAGRGHVKKERVGLCFLFCSIDLSYIYIVFVVSLFWKWNFSQLMDSFIQTLRLVYNVLYCCTYFLLSRQLLYSFVVSCRFRQARSRWNNCLISFLFFLQTNLVLRTLGAYLIFPFSTVVFDQLTCTNFYLYTV